MDKTLTIRANMLSWVKRSLEVSLIAGVLIAGCSKKDTQSQASVKGVITVADSVDGGGDFSGIEVTIIRKDSADAQADTLFHATTNKKGDFSGTARFPFHRQYMLYISRNGQDLGRTGIILAQGDTVRINGQLPDLQKTLKIESHEHEALATYQRVENGFRRIGAYAQAGRLKGDSLANELQKWSDLYWQVYQKYPATLAGNASARRSIELLDQWDKPAMMKKIRSVQQKDHYAYLGATYGKNYVAHTQGLDRALAYLDSLRRETKLPRAGMRIQMERINLLYDSARTKAARSALQHFERQYPKNKEAKQYVKSVSYDLDYLSPGDPVPDFSFDDGGNKVSRENLKGHPYLLEITMLSNPLYQQQYDRTVVIYSLYKSYGFKVITLPMDKSQVTVNAFFDDRVKPWPVAPAGTFNEKKLLKTFNIHSFPTRFLVDKNGLIVHRYVGDKYKDVLKGIQQVTKNN